MPTNSGPQGLDSRTREPPDLETKNAQFLHVGDGSQVIGATQPITVPNNIDNHDLDVHSQAANQEASSHVSVFSEMLLSDDDWEFTSCQSPHRSASTTSDLSDIVVLSISPSKEATRIDPDVRDLAEHGEDWSYENLTSEVTSELTELSVEENIRPLATQELAASERHEDKARKSDQTSGQMFPVIGCEVLTESKARASNVSREKQLLHVTRSVVNEVTEKMEEISVITKQSGRSSLLVSLIPESGHSGVSSSRTKQRKLKHKKSRTLQVLEEMALRGSSASQASSTDRGGRSDQLTLADGSKKHTREPTIVLTADTRRCGTKQLSKTVKTKRKAAATAREDVGSTERCRAVDLLSETSRLQFTESSRVQSAVSTLSPQGVECCDVREGKGEEIFFGHLVKVSPTLAENVMPALSENVLPTLAENVLPTLAENVLPTLAENVLPPLAENVLPTLAENVLPTLTESNKQFKNNIKVQGKCSRRESRRGRKRKKAVKKTSRSQSPDSLQSCDNIEAQIHADTTCTSITNYQISPHTTASGAIVLTKPTELPYCSYPLQPGAVQEELVGNGEEAKKGEYADRNQETGYLIIDPEVAGQSWLSHEDVKGHRRVKVIKRKFKQPLHGTLRSKFKVTTRDEVQRARAIKRWVAVNKIRFKQVKAVRLGEEDIVSLMKLPKEDVSLTSNKILCQLRSTNTGLARTDRPSSLVPVNYCVSDRLYFESAPDLLEPHLQTYPDLLRPHFEAHHDLLKSPFDARHEDPGSHFEARGAEVGQGKVMDVAVLRSDLGGSANAKRASYASIVKKSLKDPFPHLPTEPLPQHLLTETCLHNLPVTRQVYHTDCDMEEPMTISHRESDPCFELGSSWLTQLGDTPQLSFDGCTEEISSDSSREITSYATTDMELEKTHDLYPGRGHLPERKQISWNTQSPLGLQNLCEAYQSSQSTKERCSETLTIPPEQVTHTQKLPPEHGDCIITLEDSTVSVYNPLQSNETGNSEMSLSWPLPDLVNTTTWPGLSCPHSHDVGVSQAEAADDSLSEEYNQGHSSTTTSRSATLLLTDGNYSPSHILMRGNTANQCTTTRISDSLALPSSQEKKGDCTERRDGDMVQFESDRWPSPICPDKGKFKVKHTRVPQGRASGTTRLLARSSTETMRLKRKSKMTRANTQICDLENQLNSVQKALNKLTMEYFKLDLTCNKLKVKINDQKVKVRAYRSRGKCKEVTVLPDQAIKETSTKDGADTVEFGTPIEISSERSEVGDSRTLLKKDDIRTVTPLSASARERDKQTYRPANTTRTDTQTFSMLCSDPDVKLELPGHRPVTLRWSCTCTGSQCCEAPSCVSYVEPSVELYDSGVITSKRHGRKSASDARMHESPVNFPYPQTGIPEKDFSQPACRSDIHKRSSSRSRGHIHRDDSPPKRQKTESDSTYTHCSDQPQQYMQQLPSCSVCLSNCQGNLVETNILNAKTRNQHESQICWGTSRGHMQGRCSPQVGPYFCGSDISLNTRTNLCKPSNMADMYADDINVRHVLSRGQYCDSPPGIPYVWYDTPLDVGRESVIDNYFNRGDLDWPSSPLNGITSSAAGADNRFPDSHCTCCRLSHLIGNDKCRHQEVFPMLDDQCCEVCSHHEYHHCRTSPFCDCFLPEYPLYDLVCRDCDQCCHCAYLQKLNTCQFFHNGSGQCPSTWPPKNSFLSGSTGRKCSNDHLQQFHSTLPKASTSAITCQQVHTSPFPIWSQVPPAPDHTCTQISSPIPTCRQASLLSDATYINSPLNTAITCPQSPYFGCPQTPASPATTSPHSLHTSTLTSTEDRLPHVQHPKNNTGRLIRQNSAADKKPVWKHGCEMAARADCFVCKKQIEARRICYKSSIS